MRSMRYATVIILMLVLTACGRRLPDEYFDTDTDFAAEDTATEVAQATEEVTEVVPTAVIDNTAMDSEATEVMDEATDSEATEVVAETNDEPQFELVEVPADPIIALVANADATNGELLFNSGVPCSTCHNVDSEDALVGPGFLNLPMRAEARIEDTVAERYLYNSIIAPNDFIVDGFAGAMPATYPDTYSDEELHDIVAYLMTLGDYPEREPVFMEVPIESDEAAVTQAEPTQVPVEATDSGAETDVVTEDEVPTDADVVFVVVTATPSAATVDDTSTQAEATVEQVDDTNALVLPNFELDLSAVPETIDELARFGNVSSGEDLFTEGLINNNSCATCHSIDRNPTASQTDLSHVAQQDNAPAYIWAAVFSNELHPAFAPQYQQNLSGSDMAHLVAYLMSLNEVGE